MNHTVHRLAGAGNAAVLILLVLFLGNGDILLNPYDRTSSMESGNVSPAPTASPGQFGSRAEQAILVVIDGLRADVAADPRIMPFLCSLADRGGRGTARVESLVPSTIAGIVTLATGQVPAPVSFLFDFGSPSAATGGIFQAVTESGGNCFVAGPQLWLDLYATWIRSWHATSEFSGDDAAVLAAALKAVQDRANRLIVIHFCETDAVAHLHGGTSRPYAQTARWCDDAIRQIVEAMDGGSCLLITSDHGVTDAGGHAGPEPDVLSTPLVVFGPGMPVGPLGQLRQRDVPALLLNTSGIDSHRIASSPISARGERKRNPVLLAGLVVASLYSAARLGSRLRSAAPILHRYVALLNLTIWLALAVLLVAGWVAALTVALGAILITASAVGCRLNGRIIAAMIFGIVVGGLRLGDAFLCVHGATFSGILPASYKVLLLVAAIGILLGYLIGRWLTSDTRQAASLSGGTAGTLASSESKDFSAGLLAGVLLVIISSLAGRLVGQTFSLSSVDTHTAFHIAEGPLGIPGAVVVALVRESLPALSVLLGIVPALARLTPVRAGGLAAGLAGMIIGQAVVPALALGWSDSDQQTLAALCLGGLLRITGEAVYLFIPAALLSLRRGVICNEPESLDEKP